MPERSPFFPPSIYCRYLRYCWVFHLNLMRMGLVDVQPYISDKAVTVHIVNLNQAGFWKAPVNEITPLPAQAVKVKLPKGRGIGPVKLLVSGQEATAHVENGIATVDVSSIAGAHEVIVLELE